MTRFLNFHHAGEHGGNFRSDRVSRLCDPEKQTSPAVAADSMHYMVDMCDQPLDRDQFGDG